MSTIADLVAPLTIFLPTAAAAAYFIFVHYVASGVQPYTTIRCSYSTSEDFIYRLPYTPWPIVNEALCGVVATFHAGMASPEGLTFLKSFAVWFAPVAFFILVEACRPGQSKLLSSSLLIGVLYQVASGGVVISLYWLVFVLAGAHHLNRDTTRHFGYIKQGKAEALAFGFLVGTVIPSAALLSLEDPYVTAMWQPFTVFTSIACHIHHLIRPSQKTQQSGFTILQVVYLGIFILSSSFHVSTMWPLISEPGALHATFIPSLYPISSSPLDPTAAAHQLLQYDAIFSVSSTILGTLWFASNLRQFVGLLAWYIFASPVVGPGAAISAVMLWRESAIAVAAVPWVGEKKEL
jgi:hypothetical protein